jgi:hypothetical protein
MIVLFVVVVTWFVPLQAKAWGLSSSGTFCIPDVADYTFTDIDDAYIIITDVSNGDIYDADAATPTVTTTWADAVIACTKDAQNPYFSMATMPVLDTTKRYAIVVYEDVGGDGTPLATDPVRIDALLYDPDTRVTYTDTNPIFDKAVRVR